MQEDTSFRGDVIGLCISIKGRHTEGKGRHQRGLNLLKHDYYSPPLKRIPPYTSCCDYLTCFPQKLEKKFKEDWNSGRAGYVKQKKLRYVGLSEKCVGGSVAKEKRGKKRQKVDNADLSQLSDYAVEVFYHFFLKVIK